MENHRSRPNFAVLACGRGKTRGGSTPARGGGEEALVQAQCSGPRLFCFRGGNSPILMFPSTVTPAPSRTPFPTLGWRSPRPEPVPPRVTPCDVAGVGHNFPSAPLSQRSEGARSPSDATFVSALRTHVKNTDVVADDRRLSDHHAGGVVDEDPRPDPRRGVDVHREALAHLALQRDGERLPAALPEVVREAVRLERLVPLEVQDRLDVPLARRVSVHHGLQVDVERRDELRVGAVRLRVARSRMRGERSPTERRGGSNAEQPGVVSLGKPRQRRSRMQQDAPT